MPGTGEYVPLRGFWKAVRAGLPVDRLAHCWVLRQQGRGASPLVWGGGVHGCGLFLFVPAHAGYITGAGPFGGWRVVGMGVTGLLFENYIVDASILKIIKCNFR